MIWNKYFICCLELLLSIQKRFHVRSRMFMWEWMGESCELGDAAQGGWLLSSQIEKKSRDYSQQVQDSLACAVLPPQLEEWSPPPSTSAPHVVFNNVPKQTVLMFGHRELPRNYRCYSILLSKARLSASQTRKGLVLSVQTLMVVAWGFLESEFISKIIKEWGKC